MSSTGRAGVRQTDDFYRTPVECVNAMAGVLADLDVKLDAGICDPCGGDGAIVHRLYDLGYRSLSAVEIEESRANKIDRQRCGDVVVADFLTLRSEHLSPAIGAFVTNPPFSIAQEVAEQCFRLRPTTPVILLLRVNFTAGKKRKSFFKANPCDLDVFASRPSFMEVITWQVSVKAIKKGKTAWIKVNGPFNNEHDARLAWQERKLETPDGEFKVQRKVTKGDSCEYALFSWYEGCEGRWSRIEAQ
jgi:hypothetical protein